MLMNKATNQLQFPFRRMSHESIHASPSSSVDKKIRDSWKVDDWVEVFSRTKNEWYPAKIIDTYNDNLGEW